MKLMKCLGAVTGIIKENEPYSGEFGKKRAGYVTKGMKKSPLYLN